MDGSRTDVYYLSQSLLYKDHSMSADSNSIDIQLVFNNNSADMAKSVFMI